MVSSFPALVKLALANSTIANFSGGTVGTLILVHSRARFLGCHFLPPSLSLTRRQCIPDHRCQSHRPRFINGFMLILRTRESGIMFVFHAIVHFLFFRSQVPDPAAAIPAAPIPRVCASIPSPRQGDRRGGGGPGRDPDQPPHPV